MFSINTFVVVLVCLVKENKIKPIEDCFQNKALVYFTLGFGAFRICIYADVIIITAKSLTKEKKHFLLLTKRVGEGRTKG